MNDKVNVATTDSLVIEKTYSPEISTLQLTDSDDEPCGSIPEYLNNTYYWSYLNPRNVKWFDRELVVKLILWWQHKKLRQAAFLEITPGSSVLQVAAVYGDFSRILSKHIDVNGELKLIDITPIQVHNTRLKLAEYPHAKVHQADAATIKDKDYDVVLCYFLLHEIPDDYKTRVIDNLLRHIKTDGKLVIVDYHKPHWAHPVKPITSLVFDMLEPYAKTLWRKSIRSLASNPEHYKWRHSSYFGSLFQKVVVTKKLDKTNKEDSHVKCD
ncbi:MAG: rhodoquinone biosynthesis methyltransferase RquA [Proteobacteria bacterium]|nr:rhodoquinone biosynthesis methyltransferase RquA [Pseudomonadota bacterium]